MSPQKKLPSLAAEVASLREWMLYGTESIGDPAMAAERFERDPLLYAQPPTEFADWDDDDDEEEEEEEEGDEDDLDDYDEPEEEEEEEEEEDNHSDMETGEYLSEELDETGSDADRVPALEFADSRRGTDVSSATAAEMIERQELVESEWARPPSTGQPPSEHYTHAGADPPEDGPAGRFQLAKDDATQCYVVPWGAAHIVARDSRLRAGTNSKTGFPVSLLDREFPALAGDIPRATESWTARVSPDGELVLRCRRVFFPAQVDAILKAPEPGVRVCKHSAAYMPEIIDRAERTDAGSMRSFGIGSCLACQTDCAIDAICADHALYDGEVLHPHFRGFGWIMEIKTYHCLGRCESRLDSKWLAMTGADDDLREGVPHRAIKLWQDGGVA